MAEKNSRLAVGVLLALLVGVAYWLRYRYWILSGGLQPSYLDWAMLNYFGGLAQWNLWNAEKLLQGDFAHMVTSYPIGYPALIASVHLLGVADPQNYRLVQIGLDSAACLLAYSAVRGLGAGRAGGMLAAILYAVAPWWAWSSSTILAETLLPALFLVLLNLLQNARRRRSPGAWILLGLGAGIMPLFRAEMTLLAAPVGIWALLHGAGTWQRQEFGRRLRATTLALGMFLVPWLVAASVNYKVHGEFFVSKNVIGYVLFSGLGQLPNPYGYFTDDVKATKVLNEMGIAFNSVESERYWRPLYWKAWREHPGHVIATILYRFNVILFQPELLYRHFSGMSVLAARGPWLLALGIAVLLIRRRFSDVLLVVGPLGYALCVNGIMYVEPRYVRYAHLTYLMSAALAFDGLLSGMRLLLNRAGARVAQAAAALAAAAVFVPLIGWSLRESRELDRAANGILLASAREPSTEVDRWIVLRPGDWRTVVPGASIRDGEDGAMTVVASREVHGYQAMATLESHGADLILVEYAVKVRGGPAYLGVLSKDRMFFLDSHWVSRDTEAAGTLRIAVDAAASTLLIGAPSEDPTEIEAKGVRYMRICGDLAPEVESGFLSRLRHAVLPRRADWRAEPCDPVKWTTNPDVRGAFLAQPAAAYRLRG
ncbi:MAG TPA: glycosyltransferase family 39 protein [Xanthobacteraceae bacterium]|nr:glycosyltransferase family 39 protein [Xanthobacteraceae bacterium]